METGYGLSAELRRSLACTNVIEYMNGGAAMLEATKGFHHLKAHRQLPILKSALTAHGAGHRVKPALERQSAGT